MIRFDVRDCKNVQRYSLRISDAVAQKQDNLALVELDFFTGLRSSAAFGMLR
jgi:hypothetical protein